jgi:Flp pilus assembly pilin Flp
MTAGAPSAAGRATPTGVGHGAAAGQGLVDLGLILGIAAIVAIVAIVVFGPQLASILDFIGAQVQQPA